MHLLSVCDDVYLVVLSAWVADLRDLSAMDVAYCSTSDRPHFVQMLSRSCVPAYDLAKSHQIPALQWLTGRQVQCMALTVKASLLLQHLPTIRPLPCVRTLAIRVDIFSCTRDGCNNEEESCLDDAVLQQILIKFPCLSALACHSTKSVAIPSGQQHALIDSCGLLSPKSVALLAERWSSSLHRVSVRLPMDNELHALRKCTNLTAVDLKVLDEDLSALFRSLTAMRSLRELSLTLTCFSGSETEDSRLKLFLLGIAHRLPALTTISLFECFVSASTACELLTSSPALGRFHCEVFDVNRIQGIFTADLEHCSKSDAHALLGMMPEVKTVRFHGRKPPWGESQESFDEFVKDLSQSMNAAVECFSISRSR